MSPAGYERQIKSSIPSLSRCQSGKKRRGLGYKPIHIAPPNTSIQAIHLDIDIYPLPIEPAVVVELVPDSHSSETTPLFGLLDDTDQLVRLAAFIDIVNVDELGEMEVFQRRVEVFILVESKVLEYVDGWFGGVRVRAVVAARC